MPLTPLLVTDIGVPVVAAVNPLIEPETEAETGNGALEVTGTQAVPFQYCSSAGDADAAVLCITTASAIKSANHRDLNIGKSFCMDQSFPAA